MWRCQFLWKWDQASKPGSRDIHLNGGSNISYRCITTTTASNETDANNKTDFVDPSSQTIWVPCRWQTVWGLWCVPCLLCHTTPHWVPGTTPVQSPLGHWSQNATWMERRFAPCWEMEPSPRSHQSLPR
jgi:hypothetical protein